MPNQLMFVRLHTDTDLETGVVVRAVDYWKSSKKRRGLKKIGVALFERLEMTVKYHKEKRGVEDELNMKERIEEEKTEGIAE